MLYPLQGLAVHPVLPVLAGCYALAELLAVKIDIAAVFSYGGYYLLSTGKERACQLCAVLLVGFLPDRANVSPAPSVQYYALSSAQAEGASYAQLSQKYGGAVDALSPFEWADNAQAYYTLYLLDGQEVLVGVRLKYLRGLLFWEGTLYIDLTGGERLPQELSSFSRLDPAGSVYGCQYFSDTRYENGEFVSDASISLSSYTYYMTVEGQDRSAVYFLLRLLARS